MAEAITYAVVRVQVEGNPEVGYRTAYYTDNQRFTTRRDAIAYGWRTLDHDDFLLAHLRGEVLMMVSWQFVLGDDIERAEMAEQCGWKVKT